MAITIDVDLVQSKFEDIYAASGITPGSEIILKNKSSSKCLLVIMAPTEPLAASTEGYEIEPRSVAVVPANDENIWVRSVRGTAWINVQESPGVKPDTGLGTVVTTTPQSTNAASLDTQLILSALAQIEDRLLHLNAMVDEAFETTIMESDIPRR